MTAKKSAKRREQMSHLCRVSPLSNRRFPSLCTRRTTLALVGLLCFGFSTLPRASIVISDGSDGVFQPTSSMTINLNTVAPDGVFNFTDINIPAGVTIRFTNNSANTPVFFAATGNVVIDGTIDVSAGHFNGVPGPGGYAGGAGGDPGSGFDGGGLGGGGGGPASSARGNAGGGGGFATPGLTATSRTGVNPGAGGSAIGVSSMEPGLNGGGGNGGGGGGSGLLFGVPLDAGVGGGGGGALQISSLGDVTLAGSLVSNGGHGGWGFANVFSAGGPGGGGSGGQVALYGDSITLLETAVIEAIGGAGGGYSTETVPFDPFRYSSGANGGLGYAVLGTSNLSIAAGATVNATVIPLPAAAWLLLSAVAGLGAIARRR
jgi:hypothetical protein